MRNVKVTKQLELTMTAEDWDLYDDMPESKIAAEALNYAIMREFNAGMDRLHVSKVADKIMMKYRDCGTYDTEPRYILLGLLDKVYKDD